nr:uncharacterized protein LOC115263035 [Aedes albopictus]
MCANLEYFEEVQEPNAGTPGFVTVADGEKAMVKGVGSCQLDCYGQDGVAKKITLTQVLYVPDLDMNLVSVGQLVAKGAKVIFDQSGCTIAREDRVAAMKQEEVIKPQYLSTNDMIADMMTKPLQRVKQTRISGSCPDTTVEEE